MSARKKWLFVLSMVVVLAGLALMSIGLASCGAEATPTPAATEEPTAAPEAPTAAPEAATAAPTEATPVTVASGTTQYYFPPSDKSYMPTVGQVSAAEYKPQIRKAPKPYTFAFANLLRSHQFRMDVEKGHIEAAKEAGIELIVLDNQGEAEKALENARNMITKKVDFFVEYFQIGATNEVIGKMLMEAKIPGVAIDIVVPNIPYFGGNNYQAGSLAGEWLAKYALDNNWPQDQVRFVALNIPGIGPVAEDRMQGYKDGVKKMLPGLADDRVEIVHTGDQTEDAMERMRAWLAGHPNDKYILMGALHDGIALGMLEALRQSNREGDAVILSQGADAAMFPEIRNPESAYKGSVAYFPDKYGYNTIAIGLDVLEGKPVPEATFIQHEVVDATNIDELYPNQ